MNCDFEKLKARCLAHDEAALTELYKAMMPLATWLLTQRYGMPAADAADIAQQIMVDLTRQLATTPIPEAFVSMAARNKRVDWIRRRQARDKIIAPELVQQQDTDDISSDPVANVPDPTPFVTAMEAADIETTLQKLGTALSELKGDCSSNLKMRYYAQMAYRDIAQQSKTAETQVGVRLARCLQYLRDRLKAIPGLWEELRTL